MVNTVKGHLEKMAVRVHGAGKMSNQHSFVPAMWYIRFTGLHKIGVHNINIIRLLLLKQRLLEKLTIVISPRVTNYITDTACSPCSHVEWRFRD